MRKWAGRIEDGPLLRGEGQYTDDMRPEKVVFAAFVRSPHAHAKINGVDTSAAKAARDVIAVYTMADFEEFGLGSVTGSIPFPGKGGAMPISPFRSVLAKDKVMHAGEPVAMVVAKSEAAALDAADLVTVDYDALTAVVTLDQAKAGKTQLFAEAKGNVAFEWATPPDPDGAKKKALDEVFASAAHVVKVDVANQRICAVSMEPRAATASYDAKSGQYTMWTGTQGAAGMAFQIAMTMKVDVPKVRILTKDVGGGFGMKASTYPEYPALLAAARKLGKPVH